jgi:hypothetical protein
MEGNKIIKQIDLFEIIRFIGKRNKVFQAMILQEIESIINKDSDEYKQIRKLILDGFNNYTRNIMKIIFGDVEYLIK